MPHASLKLKPGVDQNETPALNEAGISQTQLVRFIYDRNGIGLVQKLGGWLKYSLTQTTGIARALLAWADTNSKNHLAIGTAADPVSLTPSTLSVITDGVQTTITPQETTDNVAVLASTTLGSSYVTITDATTTGVTDYDSVYIQTHISVGGLILFGLYPCGTFGATQYKIFVTDILGEPAYATSTQINSGAVAVFGSTINSSTITVTLNNHGYEAGSTYPILVTTTIAGITLYGNYIVTSVLDVNTFTINSDANASLTTSLSINGGLARYTYNFGVGALASGSGFGSGGFGSGGFGTGTAITPSLGTPITAEDWTLDNWGEILLANPITNNDFQPIYQWNPLGTGWATIIPEAPPVNDGFFVAMPQRQVVAWGSSFTGIPDPLLLRWCDVNNFYSWVGTVVNQAGSYRIPRGSKIVACIQGPQQGLIWTDLGVWSMQYVGLPYVYSINEIGTGCGLIGRRAAGAINGTVFWMGASSFFALSGSGVTPIPCPTWDIIFQDLDHDNLQKIRIAINSRFGEVTWWYPTMSSGGEVNAYVKYNVNLNQWDYGINGTASNGLNTNVSRSAWIDQSVLGPPIGADPNTRYIYQHESSTDADDQAMITRFRTGYYAMDEADQKSFVDEIWPDMKWGYYNGSQNATINLKFYTTDFAGQTPTEYGPFVLNQTTTWVNPRIRARLMAFELSSNDVGSFWRIGNMRYRVQPDGKY